MLKLHLVKLIMKYDETNISVCYEKLKMRILLKYFDLKLIKKLHIDFIIIIIQYLQEYMLHDLKMCVAKCTKRHVLQTNQ